MERRMFGIDFQSHHWVIMALGIVCASCSSTKYSSLNTNTRTGYWERQLDSVTWEVHFIASPTTEIPLVNRYVLYRAAELTTAHGFEYFRLLDYSNSATGGLNAIQANSRIDTSSCINTPPLEARRPGIAFDPGTHSTVATVRMFHGICPVNDSLFYDARFLLASVGPSIARGD